jgi:hypothetical protein
MLYTQLVIFNEEDYVCKVAKSIEEARRTGSWDLSPQEVEMSPEIRPHMTVF